MSKKWLGATMDCVIKNSFPFSKNGLPNESLYFCDGRLAFSFDHQGVKELRYFMPFVPYV